MPTRAYPILAPIVVPHRSPTVRGRRVNMKWREVMSWFWILSYVLRSAIWWGGTWKKVAIEFLAFPSSAIALILLTLLSFALPLHVSPNPLLRQPWPLIETYHSILVSISPPKMHLQGRTRGESITHRHPIATWYMPLKNAHLIPWFWVPLARSDPRPL